MNSAEYVDKRIQEEIEKGTAKPNIVWMAAELCLGWPYVFGCRGEKCTPAERRKRYSEKHPTIKSKCKNFEGTSTCDGCKWFPCGKRTRCFDCRGFTYWCLKQVGIIIMGVGATSQWNDEDNWSEKGTIDSCPEDKLVCLFVNEGKTMKHTGFGWCGVTIECSNGVQESQVMNKKWTHWAVPKGLYDDAGKGETDLLPVRTLKRGCKGTDVVNLQKMLVDFGYSVGKSGIDGVFGKDTEEAVKKFQSFNNLKADGIAGPKTLEVLQNFENLTYTVKVPNLSFDEANDLISKYEGAVFVL